MSESLPFDRRRLLHAGAAGVFSLAFGGHVTGQQPANEKPRNKPTRFQIACMTLPYSQYPLERALSGIKSAGYQYVAWGTSHKEEGESNRVPVMAADAPPEKAKLLGQKCRDMGREIGR